MFRFPVCSDFLIFRSSVRLLIERDKSALLSLPAVRFSPFFAAGMLTVYFGGGSSGAILFAAASAALIFFLVKRKSLAICAAGAILGVVIMSVYMYRYYYPIREYAGRTIDAEIYVMEVTARSGQSEEITAKAVIGGRTVRLRLSCPETLPEDHRSDVTIELDETELTASDLSRGILLSGEVVEIRSAEYMGLTAASVFRIIRGNFYGRLARNVFGDSRDLASAMLFGEDGKLSPKFTEYLRVSGVAHYTAVSGAHFAVFAAVLLSLISQERRRARFLTALLFAPMGLLFYGASPSVLRASLMFFIYSLGMLFHRKSHPLNSLCIAIAVIPMISPLTIVDAGFAMSVLGVFGVGVVGPEVSRKLCEFIAEKPDAVKRVLTPIVTALACSFCAVICTSPISAVLFKSVSPIGAITSILIAPLMATAMTFMILLGAVNIRLFAVPIDWSMKLAAAIIRLFGKCRALSLSLDFEGAWVLAAVLAVLVAICAFCDLKSFVRVGKAAIAIIIMIPTISAITTARRHEIRFVGNTYTSAAIVLDGNTAAVYISGGGDGLSESISRTLRERGAVKITTVFASDADYGGALALRELSEMIPIGEIRSNELAAGLLPDLPVSVNTGGEVFTIDGVTIASATASEPAPKVDVLLYGGRMDKASTSPAKVAVYFTKAEYELPENFHNARVDRELCVIL